MLVKRECSVVMLPSEKATVGTIMKYTNIMDFHNDEVDVHVGGLLLNKNSNVSHRTLYHEPQHLYFTSTEDRIMPGEWVITSSGVLRKCIAVNDEGRLSLGGIDFLTIHPKTCKKVIATTDESIMVVKYTQGGYVINGGVPLPLPQPSSGFISKFIEAHNSGNPIEKVMVDFEADYDDLHGGFHADTISLVVNQRDNTITISKIKTTYTQEEVDALLDRQAAQTTAQVLSKFKNHVSREEVAKIVMDALAQSKTAYSELDKIGVDKWVEKYILL